MPSAWSSIKLTTVSAVSPFVPLAIVTMGSDRIRQLMSAVRETKSLSEYHLTAAVHRNDTRETVLISNQADRF